MVDVAAPPSQTPSYSITYPSSEHGNVGDDGHTDSTTHLVLHGTTPRPGMLVYFYDNGQIIGAGKSDEQGNLTFNVPSNYSADGEHHYSVGPRSQASVGESFDLTIGHAAATRNEAERLLSNPPAANCP